MSQVWEFVPPDELIRLVSELSWRETFLGLADIAFMMGRERTAMSDRVRRHTIEALIHWGKERGSEYARLATGLAQLGSDQVVAHEAVIYLLQALSIVHGAEDDGGRTPTPELLTYLMLCANQFVGEWTNPNSRELTRRERQLVATVRPLLFDRPYNRLHALIRGFLMMKEPPPRHAEWKSQDDWHDFQHSAFGMSLAEYLEALAGPIVMQSILWGEVDADDTIRRALLDPEKWLSETTLDATLGRAYLEELTWNRADARKELRKGIRDDGLIVSPKIFYRRPFMRVSSTQVAPASPWVLAEQLRAALWGKQLAAAKERDPQQGHRRWFSAFGDMFERWCHSVAKQAVEAAESDDLTILESDIGSAQEIEDVVFLTRRKVVLVSVKANVIPEVKLKGANSEESVVQWYEGFLFRGNDPDLGKGAIRKLDAKIQRIKRGEFKEIPKRHVIFPVIVTYDRLGCDNPAVYLWVRARCNQEGLMKHCRPLTFFSVEQFEEFMAAVSAGHDLGTMLDKKTTGEWAVTPTSTFLHEQAISDSSELRLPRVDEELERIVMRIGKRLFANDREWGGDGDSET